MSNPTTTKIRRTPSALSRKARHSKAAEVPTSLTEEQIQKIKELQQEIDEYNNKDIYEIDPFFKDMQLNGDWIIVRMFHENLIKNIDESNPKDIQIDAWFRQIDGRERNTDPPKWVPTPFPYVEEGVVVAISPELVLKYYKLKSELEGYNPTLAADMHIPAVGDIVTIKANLSQWFKDARYYIDKQEQCQDFVRNQTELRLNHFKHYFRVESYDIESWRKTDQKGYIPQTLDSESKHNNNEESKQDN